MQSEFFEQKDLLRRLHYKKASFHDFALYTFF